jgi:hypothetical protein
MGAAASSLPPALTRSEATSLLGAQLSEERWSAIARGRTTLPRPELQAAIRAFQAQAGGACTSGSGSGAVVLDPRGSGSCNGEESETHGAVPKSEEQVPRSVSFFDGRTVTVNTTQRTRVRELKHDVAEQMTALQTTPAGWSTCNGENGHSNNSSPAERFRIYAEGCEDALFDEELLPAQPGGQGPGANLFALESDGPDERQQSGPPEFAALKRQVAESVLTKNLLHGMHHPGFLAFLNFRVVYDRGRDELQEVMGQVVYTVPNVRRFLAQNGGREQIDTDAVERALVYMGTSLAHRDPNSEVLGTEEWLCETYESHFFHEIASRTIDYHQATNPSKAVAAKFKKLEISVEPLLARLPANFYSECLDQKCSFLDTDGAAQNQEWIRENFPHEQRKHLFWLPGFLRPLLPVVADCGFPGATQDPAMQDQVPVVMLAELRNCSSLEDLSRLAEKYSAHPAKEDAMRRARQESESEKAARTRTSCMSVAHYYTQLGAVSIDRVDRMRAQTNLRVNAGERLGVYR